MRIAVVTTSFPRRAGDGAGHFVETEVKELVAAGHDVTVLAPGIGESTVAARLTVDWIEDRGASGWPGTMARLKDDPSRALGLGRFAAVAAWRLRATHFDRVIAHWLVPCGVPIALAARAPVEVVAHGSDVRLLLQRALLRRWVVGRLLAMGAEVRFVSHALRDALVAVSDPRLLGSSTVRASPIDVRGIAERARARAELGVAADARLIVLASRLVPSKRLEVGLAAATLIPNAEVVVVGDGPERAALERDFAEARFIGHVPRADALTWIAAADVVLSASRCEGAPTVVREARALGVPVVAAPSGDLLRWAADDPGISVVS